MLPVGRRFRTCWSAIRALVVVFVSWTLVSTHCKPLQQQSNDRLLISNDRLAITDLYGLDSDDDASVDGPSRGEPEDIRLQTLTRTMNALAQFRRVISNRLLTGNEVAQINEGSRDENFDAQRRSSFLVDAEDERTLRATPSPQKAQHRNHHRRKPHDRTAGGGLERPFQREQRQDPESQSNAYVGHGFNVKAHLQPEPVARDDGQQLTDEHRQRFMTGRTTAIDEQQFGLFSDVPDFECPRLQGKTTQVLCPSRRSNGYRVCVPDTALCNEKLDCPNGEDEDPVNCLFYKTTIHHFRLVVDAVVELSDLVKQQQRRRGVDEL